MASVDDVVLNSIARITIGFVDQANERARKVTRLASLGSAENIGHVVNHLNDLSHAGYTSLKISSTVAAALESGDETVTLSGLYTLVNLRLILGFERVHPLNPSKTLTAGYAIPAPVNTIVSATNPKRPLMTRGTALSAAATDLTKLGAIVDYLETALVYTAADGVDYVGEWTYVDARSGLATVAGVIDGDIRT